MGGLVCALLVSSRGLAGSRGTDQQNLAVNHPTTLPQARISVPVTVKQLDLVNGVIPVYLNCEETVLIVPNTLDRIPCTIKNNLGKGIRALVLGEYVSIDNNGTRSTELGYVTIDTFVHPDFHADSKERKEINQNSQFPSAAETYSGFITQVQVRVDYVEFNDKETLGPNKAGEHILFDLRDGASKYKRWLVKEFETNGKSVPSLIPLIEENALSADLGIQNDSEERGAVIYRNWLRKIYKTEGVERIRKHLDYQSPAIK